MRFARGLYLFELLPEEAVELSDGVLVAPAVNAACLIVQFAPFLVREHLVNTLEGLKLRGGVLACHTNTFV